MGIVHHIDEIFILLWLDEIDIGGVGEEFIDRFLNIWIEVDGVDDIDIGIVLCDFLRAWQMWMNPSPKFSLLCPVTRIKRLFSSIV
jgi:hypothetical protein